MTLRPLRQRRPKTRPQDQHHNVGFRRRNNSVLEMTGCQHRLRFPKNRCNLENSRVFLCQFLDNKSRAPTLYTDVGGRRKEDPERIGHDTPFNGNWLCRLSDGNGTTDWHSPSNRRSSPAHRGRGFRSSYQDSTIPTRSVRHATRIRDRSERWENLDHIKAWSDLEVEAEARGMPPAKLVRQLLEIIA